MSVSLHFALFCVVFLFPIFSAHAQQEARPYVVSERVGRTIDVQERSYFGLFPRSDDFVRAVARQDTAGTVTFVVNPGDSAATEITVSWRAAAELASYIDRFEKVYMDVSAVEWSHLAKVATPVEEFDRGMDLDVATMDAQHVHGRLLYVDEDVMVVSRADGPPEQLTDTTQVVVIRPEAVKLIEGGRAFLSGVTIPQGGDTTVYRQVTLPRLKERAVFENVPSPEVLALIRRESRLPTPHYPAPGEAFRSRFDAALHLSLRLDYPMHPLFSRYTMVVHDDPIENHFSSPALAAAATVRYDLTERLAVQTDLRYVPAWYIEQDNKRSFTQYDYGPGYIAAAGWFVSGLISYKITPFDGFRYLVDPDLSPFEMAEIAVGVGPSVGLLRLETHPNVFGHLSGEQETYTDRQQKVGMHAGAMGSFYPSRAVSVDVNVGVSLYPGVHVEGRDFHLKELRSSDHMLVLPDVSAGVGFHF